MLANIYLSVLDRHFAAIEQRDMSPPWRRQQRRRRGLPNYRLVRFADDFVVLVHGNQSDAETLRAEIGELLASELKMTLSEEKTHVTHVVLLTELTPVFPQAVEGAVGVPASLSA